MEARRLLARSTGFNGRRRNVRLSNRRIDRAFSLLELVIVVVIIGIIAAIAIPRLSRGSEGAARAAIVGDLAVVRRALDYYMTEHIGNAPWVGATFESQMTQYTDVNGNTSAVKVSPFIYGPYLRAIPANPYGGTDPYGVAAASKANAESRTIVGASAQGWAYFPGTGGASVIFYANTDSDDGTIDEHEF
jgi:general secretion pathway protein G